MKATRNLVGRLNLVVGIALGTIMTNGNHEFPLILDATLFVFTFVAFLLSKDE